MGSTKDVPGYKIIAYSPITTQKASQEYARSLGGQPGWALGVQTQPEQWAVYVPIQDARQQVTDQQRQEASAAFVHEESAMEFQEARQQQVQAGIVRPKEEVVTIDIDGKTIGVSPGVAEKIQEEVIPYQEFQERRQEQIQAGIITQSSLIKTQPKIQTPQNKPEIRETTIPKPVVIETPDQKFAREESEKLWQEQVKREYENMPKIKKIAVNIASVFTPEFSSYAWGGFGKVEGTPYTGIKMKEAVVLPSLSRIKQQTEGKTKTEIFFEGVKESISTFPTQIASFPLQTELIKTLKPKPPIYKALKLKSEEFIPEASGKLGKIKQSLNLEKINNLPKLSSEDIIPSKYEETVVKVSGGRGALKTVKGIARSKYISSPKESLFDNSFFEPEGYLGELDFTGTKNVIPMTEIKITEVSGGFGNVKTNIKPGTYTYKSYTFPELIPVNEEPVYTLYSTSGTLGALKPFSPLLESKTTETIPLSIIPKPITDTKISTLTSTKEKVIEYDKPIIYPKEKISYPTTMQKKKSNIYTEMVYYQPIPKYEESKLTQLTTSLLQPQKFETIQSQNLESMQKSIQSQSTRLDQMQIKEQIPITQEKFMINQKQIISLKQIPIKTTGKLTTGLNIPQKTPPIIPPPKLPPIKKTPPIKYKQNIQGFNVYVKKLGKWVKATGQPLLKGEAMKYGGYLVETTPRASFKLEPAFEAPAITNLPYRYRENIFRPPKRKRVTTGEEIFIEKSKYRINTPGEYQGITLKGIEAPKRRKGKKFKMGF